MDFWRKLNNRRRLELLRTDVVVWNELRATKDATGMAFQNSQLRQASLPWANLGELDFSRIGLQRG